MSLLKLYLKSYTYRDIHLSPPKSFSHLQFDILNELERIKTTTFEDAYAFHEALSQVIVRLHDKNTLYSFPCAKFFTYHLPYGFSLANTADDLNTVVHIIQNPDIGLFTHYLNDANKSPKNVSGRIVKRIILDGETKDPNESPEETILRWSIQNNPFCRLPASQFSTALSKYFFTRPVAFFKRPQGNITVILAPESSTDSSGDSALSSASAEEEVIQIPFYATSTASVSGLSNTRSIALT